MYCLPASTERHHDPESGRNVVVPGSYHRVPPSPVGAFQTFVAIPRGMTGAASVIFLVFLVGGAVTVIDETGALRQATEWLAVGAGSAARTRGADCVRRICPWRRARRHVRGSHCAHSRARDAGQARRLRRDDRRVNEPRSGRHRRDLFANQPIQRRHRTEVGGAPAAVGRMVPSGRPDSGRRHLDLGHDAACGPDPDGACRRRRCPRRLARRQACRDAPCGPCSIRRLHRRHSSIRLGIRRDVGAVLPDGHRSRPGRRARHCRHGSRICERVQNHGIRRPAHRRE